MERFPKLLRAPGARFVARLALGEGPLLAGVDRVHVLEPVLLRAAHARFEPRIENDRPLRPEEVADAVAPAELFLVRARGDKIHRPGEINARAVQEILLAHGREYNARRGDGNLSDRLITAVANDPAMGIWVNLEYVGPARKFAEEGPAEPSAPER